MAEYIEREAERGVCERPPITQAIEEQGLFIRRDDVINVIEFTNTFTFSREITIEKLRDIPAADVRPVVRGRWIKLDMHNGMEQHKCSVCNQECYVPTCMGEPLYAYCPNCGADMREGQDDD